MADDVRIVGSFVIHEHSPEIIALRKRFLEDGLSVDERASIRKRFEEEYWKIINMRQRR